MHHRQKDDAAAWLYCDACHARLFHESSEDSSTVPFRDTASLRCTLGLREEGDPAHAAERFAATEVTLVLQQLREKWEQARRRASRPNPQRGAKLNFRNLVPAPAHEYWQSTPEAPFEKLTSEKARGALACCNLMSSMKQHQDLKGRAAYASSVGETIFCRRRPEQLATTLAFMLGRDEGRIFQVRESEVEPLRECLLWLRERNPHVKH